MKKSTRIWLGIATIWPFLYIGLFFVVVVSFILLAPNTPASAPGQESPLGALFPVGFIALFVVNLLTILGHLALTVFYIIRVIKSEQLDQNLKIAWMLLLFFVGMLVQPVFWYLYIWREQPAPSLAGDEARTLSSGGPFPSTGERAGQGHETDYVPTSPPP